jgi:hypothetical protein
VKTVALLAAVGLPFFSAININFDSMKLGELPSGWAPCVTSPSARTNWTIQHDPTAPSRPNVLARVSDTPRFTPCLFEKVTAVDGDVSVKIKILSGKDRQEAGVVFRAADPNNYYLVRASARDHNIMMFRVKDGNFEPIRVNGARRGHFGVPHPIKIGDWNLLRVTYKGSLATVYFNHRKVFDANDGALNVPGRAGVWTGGETIAHFDDFRIDRKR